MKRLLVSSLAAAGCGIVLAVVASADSGSTKLTVSVTAATDHLQVSAPGAATAGSPFAVVVTAQDRNGNVTPGYRDTVRLTSSDPAAVLPADYPFTTGSGADNGVHTFTVTLKTAEPQTITATDTSNSQITGTAVVTVNAGQAVRYTVAAPSPVMQGSPFSITVVAFDAFNNIATGYQGIVHFTSSDPRAVLPSDSPLIAGAGQAHFPITLRTAGSQTITATDTTTPSITGTANISVIAVPLNMVGQTMTPIEGTSFTGILATFDDPVLHEPAGTYAASISWGDNTSSSGTVAALGSSFTVTGTHTYVEEGSFTLSITVVDADGSSGFTAGSASVQDAALTGSPVAVNATEGAPFSGAVAHFTDADPGGVTSDYVATINWGDGQPASTGTIVPSGTGFDVTGSHTYGEEGLYAVSVVITDSGGSFIPASSTSAVADAPLTAHPMTVSATEGRSFSGQVATFTDSAPAEPAGNYTATVAWGDGSSSTGSVTVSGATIAVSGTHTYQEESASMPVSVALTDDGGSTVMAASTAQIADAALSAAAGNPLSPVLNGSFTATVATFTDADPGGVASDYTATIDWGDHATSAGTIAVAGGGFSVTGTHTYTSVGSFTIAVSIRDAGGSSATTSLVAKTTYNICVLYDQTKSVKSGATVPIKLEICDANGNDRSSASVVVSATSVVQISTHDTGLPEASGNQSDTNFRFDSTLGTGGGYIYNLSTKGFAIGTYALTFTVTGDPVAHSVQFEVR